MDVFETLKECRKYAPNAIHKKIISGLKTGQWVCFHDYSTYERWKAAKMVK